MKPRQNLWGRLDRLEQRAEPDTPPILVVATEADRAEAEARHRAALARGERPAAVVTIGGIDLGRDV